MNFFIRHKVVIWILSGILIVTLSVLGSVIYFTWKEQVEIEHMPECTTSCQMMMTALDFMPSQRAELDDILNRYRDTSEALMNSLREDRLALMDELQKEYPDTLQLRLLTEDIGNLQALLTSLAAHQYLQIREICDSSQQVKLSDFYCDMFGCPRVGMGQGQGNGKGHGQHRHGNGKK